MTRIVKAIFLILLSYILCGVRAEARTVTANSCAASDVQAAINQTSNGDTVTIPGGSATWNTTVTISSSHQISLNGGGCTVTWGASGYLGITSGTVANTEVTNFTFKGAFVNGYYPISFTTSTSPLSLAFRFYGNTLSCGTPGAPSTFIGIYGNAPGVIDHNSFSCGNGADEMIHVLGNGAGDNSGWLDVVTPGGPNMVFIEDNNFVDTGGGGSSAIQAYYGARVVFRHNYVNKMQIDTHGGIGGAIGTRWWEVYSNTFTNGLALCFRDGSGMAFGNTGDTSVNMIKEQGTYPSLYQVGQGQVQAGVATNCSTTGPPGCVHAYVWNDLVPTLNTVGCGLQEAGMIQFERDVYAQGDGGNGVRTGTFASRPGTCTPYQGYWATDQNELYECLTTNTWTASYTPYTYPHPLTQGQDPPNPPSNLSAIPQ